MIVLFTFWSYLLFYLLSFSLLLFAKKLLIEVNIFKFYKIYFLITIFTI